MKYPDFDGTQLCSEMDADIFFPPGDGYGTMITRQAKNVCVRCHFLDECGEWALHHADPYGIYGAMTPTDRHRIRKERNIIPEVVTIEQIFGRQYTHREAS